MQPYDAEFYKDRHTSTRFAAETILSLVQGAIPEITTAIDIGCGVGTWLSVLREQGTSEVIGIDGEWVNVESLVIPSECFWRRDLSRDDVHLDKRFDLAISLEVAEHLPADRAQQFVAQLTRLSDFVLFSAAVPGQGGANHINEQWPEYWVELFQQHNYGVFDIIRGHIWSDDAIAVHYRQNILLFVRAERAPDVRIGDDLGGHSPLSVVHPKLFLNKIRALTNPTIGQSAKLLAAAVMRRIRRNLGGLIGGDGGHPVPPEGS